MNKTVTDKSVSAAYCMVQFLYWAGGCVAVGFATAFLSEIGFSNTGIGLITSVSSVAGFTLMMAVSALIDLRGGNSLRNFLFGTVALQTLLLLMIFLLRRPNLITAVGYLLYMSSAHLLYSLVTKLYIDLNKDGFQINFGIARGLGSLAYALASFLAGWVKAAKPSSFFQFVGQGCFLCVLVISLLLCRLLTEKTDHQKNEKQPRNTITAALQLVRADRLFLFLAASVALVSACNKTLTAFLVNVVDYAGGDIKAFGVLHGYLALIEVPVILFYSRFRRRFSAHALLLTSMVFFTLKMVAFTVIHSIPVLLLASTLQAFSVGLYHPSTVDFVIERLPHERTATGQSLLTGMPLLFSFISTISFGFLLDRHPVPACMLLLLLLSAAGTLICARCMKKMQLPDRPGDRG